jgi:multicomponent Na+:H+ antiporter subunit D
MHSSLVLFPFFSVIILNLPFKGLMQKIAFGLGLWLAIMQVGMVLFPAAFFWSSSLDVFGNFLRFNFVVDGLSLVLLLSIGLVSLVVLLMGRYMIVGETQRFNFVNLILLVMAGMNGVVMVRDIFSLYVFLEITAVSSFILIAFYKDVSALEAAFKYIILSAVATVLMLAAIALLLLVSGDTRFEAINAALKDSQHAFILMLAVGMFICGLFIKAGLMPFHGWLPDAYSAAPAPISVLLAGIVTKTVGVYTLIRIVSAVFGFDNPLKQILLLVGAISIVLGALAALGQSDFKRMLAYSSISQVGYIIIGLGCGTALGIAGAVFHLFNHSIFKSLLFVNSAAVETQTGTRDMDKLSGLAERMPLTGITSALGFLSASGIPPLAGFWSKLIIIIALWLAGYHVYAVVAILAGVLTLAYFLSMQRRVFFGKLAEEFSDVKEAGAGLALPAVILSVITVAAGLGFPVILNKFILPLGIILRG